jgi:hypothetical protein
LHLDNGTNKTLKTIKMKKTLDNLIENIEKEKNQGCSHWCIHDLIAQLYIAKESQEEQLLNYHNYLIEKFTKLEFTFNTNAQLIIQNFKNTNK